MERNAATQLLQYIAPTEKNGFDQFYAYDPKHTSRRTTHEDMFLNMAYEMHMGTNLGYLFFGVQGYFTLGEAWAITTSEKQM